MKAGSVNTSIVIFGASGDLTQRKLIPSLFNLYRKGRLRGPFRVLGHSKTAFSDDEFRRHLGDGLRAHAGFQYTDDEWGSFAESVSYHRGTYESIEDFRSLGRALAVNENEAGNRLYYMATPPGLFPPQGGPQG